MNSQQLAYGHKEFTLKVAPLVGENLERASKPGEEMAHSG
jgi:hypothetical protein